MSRTLTRILGTGSKADSSEYQAMVESGGRPQMGFAVTRASGAMDGFLYHSLDNIRFLERDGLEFLTFTHRATAVTVQGSRLKTVFRAMMRHTLIEINEYDGRERSEGDDMPIIDRVAVSYANELPDR